MDPDGTYFTAYRLFLVLLLMMNAVYTIGDTTAEMSDSRIKALAANSDKHEKTIEKLFLKTGKFSICMQAGSVIIPLLFYAMAAPAVYLQMTEFLQNRLSASLMWLPIAAAVLLIGALLLLFGRIVPRIITLEKAETVVESCLWAIQVCYLIMLPFSWLLSILAGFIVRVFGVTNAEKPENVTEEEIRMLVDASNEIGEIEQTEKDMINSIFEFDDTTVSEVMTHRTEVCALDQHTTISQAIQTFVESGHSRMPVYDGGIDSVIGLLYAKDMLKLADNRDAMDNIIKVYVRPAMFVPESMRCDELMKAFKGKKVQIAVVVDEYGGTSGVVTMEDLLETIVGSIQDEYDHEEAESSRISDNCFILDGSLSLDEVERILQTDFVSEEESEEYDTLCGLLMHKLDRIPEEWEHPVVKFDEVCFTVIEMDDRFMSKIKAEIIPKPIDAEN
ncbi:MAG: HlyC/CorC family transporter [Oscillospiraceae bacterium]|nr:HlyC/CorC family transporter [Oscillospiraceae bacterium]